MLAEHLESVRLEIRHTQARLSARTRELESESHLRELAAREGGRLRSDIARLGRRRAEDAQRVTGLQTELFKAGEQLAQFKLVQNWNQVGAAAGLLSKEARHGQARAAYHSLCSLGCGGRDSWPAGSATLTLAGLNAGHLGGQQQVTSVTYPLLKPARLPAPACVALAPLQEELEQWAAAARQKEEDSLALERYRRQDEASIRELGLQLERATREAHQGRRDLEEEQTATQVGVGCNGPQACKAQGHAAQGQACAVVLKALSRRAPVLQSTLSFHWNAPQCSGLPGLQAAQAELGKAAQDFRRLHEERQELLGQWEGVLKAVSKRDAAILEAGKCSDGAVSGGWGWMKALGLQCRPKECSPCVDSLQHRPPICHAPTCRPGGGGAQGGAGGAAG